MAILHGHAGSHWRSIPFDHLPDPLSCLNRGLVILREIQADGML